MHVATTVLHVPSDWHTIEVSETTEEDSTYPESHSSVAVSLTTFVPLVLKLPLSGTGASPQAKT